MGLVWKPLVDVNGEVSNPSHRSEGRQGKH